MVEPKELVVTTQAGNQKTFLLSKFPAIAGREIVTKYPLSNIPKIGEYQQSEEVMLKLMAHVSVLTPDGGTLKLTTRALVDNHCEDWETLARVEWAQLEYNVSFFSKGTNSDFFASIVRKVEASIMPMLTRLLAASSPTGKPPSTS